MYTNFIYLLIVGYLLGSIPFGFLISKLKSIDIRKVGSGNIGATNVSRAIGFRWFFVVAFLDALKGAIPVILAKNYLFADWQIMLVAIVTILGHIFPVWLKFKGGKGVSTSAGVLLALLGWKFFASLILIWLLFLYIFKMVSLASLISSLFLPVIFWMIFSSISSLVFGFFLIVLIFWAHRGNIARIKAGTERKIGPKPNQ